MNRHEIQLLIKWKGKRGRKPLLLRGARQVGKTWLMKEFGRTQFTHVAYVNLESDPALKEVFRGDYDIKRILTAISIASGTDIEPENTLIILDEIQESPGAITSLKYFEENAPEYAVISAGSLLGVALAQNNTSFPVGKVEFLDLHPFSFMEFLDAVGESPLADLVRSKDWPLIKAFRDKFIERLKQYYFVGGMPEVVGAFTGNQDFDEVREIQRRILLSYEHDFAKHAPTAIVPRIRMIWNAIPSQLAKENRKFIYGQLRQGARAKDFEAAIDWLIDCGLVYKVTNVSKPALPLKSYEEINIFKLFLVDTGLMTAMTGLDVKTLIQGSELFTEFRGALTEQYVMQQLRSHRDLSVHYWSPGQSTAEIDFVVQSDGQVIPVEVKAEENLKSKSLKVYVEKYSPSKAVRTSMSDFRKEAWMTNIPLYAIHNFNV